MRSALRTFREQAGLLKVLSFCKSMVVTPIGKKGGLTRCTGIWCTGMVAIANQRPIDAGITTTVTGGEATRGITTKARRRGGVATSLGSSAAWFGTSAFAPRRPEVELRIAIGQELLNLVADGVTDPGRLRQITVESLLFTRH